MPTLDEIRAALRQGDDPAAIAPKVSRGLDREKIKRKRSNARYTVSIDGTDVTLHFGKWEGSSVSDMAKRSDGRDYLKYILREFKDKDLLEVVRYQMTVAGFAPEED